ncbi:hypothetical protein, partial [Volucribacter amazonae]
MNNSKILKIVQEIAISLDIRLNKKENIYSGLHFESRIRGVEIYLYFNYQTKDKNKVQAYLLVGTNDNYEPYFSKKITFNDTKSDKAIFKDLMQRLEMNKINEKIDTILSYRAEKLEKMDKEKAELAAFQRFISFENANCRGLFSGRKNGVYFQLSQYKDQLHINTKNKNILLRICAAAAQIIE